MDLGKIAVIGAGNGGSVDIGQSGPDGHSVNLFELERFGENISQIKEIGGIYLTGVS